MDAYLERIIAQARGLQEKMGAFPQLDKPLYEFFAGITAFELRPDDKCAEAQVTFGLVQSNEFADLGDYWSHICGVLAGGASPGQKAKALFSFDRALRTYYFRKGVAQGSKEQQAVLTAVQQMLYDLTQKAPKRPCIVFVPKTGKQQPGITQMNKVSLEDKLFLDYGEIEKLFDFTNTRRFSEGMPYVAVLSGLVFRAYEP